MSGKGSGRRPGTGYAEGWDAIFGRAKDAGPQCKCTFSQRMLGDGCDICNPEYAAELAAEQEGEKED